MACALLSSRASGMLATLSIFAILVVSVYSACDNGNNNEYGNKCFKFVHNDRKNFDEAQAECNDWDGNLASVHSNALSGFVRSRLSTVNGGDGDWWIGHQRFDGQPWFWVDGQQEQSEFFGTPRLTHEEAKEWCRSNQGELASIHNSNEEADARRECECFPCWIGLVRDNSNSPFRWLDGTSFTYENWFGNQPHPNRVQKLVVMGSFCGWYDTHGINNGDWQRYHGVCRRSASTYENWDETQPDDSGGNQDCALMKTGDDGDWYDEACSEENKFICTKPSMECTDGSVTHLYARKGYISEGPLNEQYRNRHDCRWVIHAPSSDCTIKLTFDYFTTETNWDFLEIYDGASQNNHRLAKLHGGTNPGYDDSNCGRDHVLESTGPTMLLKWTTDYCIQSEGWGLYYEAICDNPCDLCHSELATCVNDVCVCNEGYQGNGEECNNINECETNDDDCDEHATCSNNQGSFTCACNVGYSNGDAQYPGTVCNNKNECSLHTANCHDEATCSDNDGSFSCACNEGWHDPEGVAFPGVECEDDDECEGEGGGHNCLSSHAKCHNDDGSFHCSCNAGYQGNGEGSNGCVDIDECDGRPNKCHSLAECINQLGTYTCGACRTGYTGDGVLVSQGGTGCSDVNECTDGIHSCDVEPVEAAATCTNNHGSFTCACPSGWQTVSGQAAGTECEDIDECTSGELVCHADAICRNINGGKECECKPGYSGDGLPTGGTGCTNINECSEKADECDDNADCVDETPGYDCVCNDGYTGNGFSCNNVNECSEETDDCHANAKCEDNEGAYSCTCLSGFTGDGRTSGTGCTDDDECTDSGHNCHAEATCTNTPPGAFTCDCDEGWSGNGVQCTDINECNNAALNDCHADAQCVNNDGSFDCTCLDGYSNEGTPEGVNCVNDDECAGEGDGHNCDARATCADLPGTFECTCNAGYQGAGTEGQCLNENECDPAEEHACDRMFGFCFDTIGSFTCGCRDGFTLDTADNNTCIDDNECEGGGDVCRGDAVCTNTDGSFQCLCASQSGKDVGDGECKGLCSEEQAKLCHHLAYCEDEECVCFSGMIGDGYLAGSGCNRESYSVRFSVRVPYELGDANIFNGKLKEWETARTCFVALFDGFSPLPAGFAQTLHHEVVATDVGTMLVLNSLFTNSSEAYRARQFLADRLAADPTPECFGITFEPENFPLEPRVYRWVAPTSSAEMQIAPTGMSVERVYFQANCGDAGCWVVDVIYTTGIDTFNTFFLPHAVGDETASGDFDYDKNMTEQWETTALETFLPVNHPCRTFDYEPDASAASPPWEVTACCIPAFVDLYRPVEAFVAAVDAYCNVECFDETRIPLFMPGSPYELREDAQYVAKPIDHMSGTFKGLNISHVDFTGIVDPFIRQYTATFYLDDLELRRYAGMLRGTVGVEYSIDTFIGMANFKPTGIEFLDPFATQVNLHLERTQFFSVSTHGVNEYTFLSYVNMRLVAVYNEDANRQEDADAVQDRTTRTDASNAAHYVQVTFTVGPQYEPNQNSGLIPLDSVLAGQGEFMSNPTQDGETAGMMHACDMWAEDTFPQKSVFEARIPELDGRTTQLCAPAATMCASPLSLADQFAVFNIPLGIDWFPSTTADLSKNVFVSLVVSAVDKAAQSRGTTPNAGEDAWQMKTTLLASIPVVDGGVNIFCDGITAKTDLKDVADMDLVIGTASNATELTRLTIYQDIASSNLQAPSSTFIDTDSIEAGFMTLVVKGNATYFGRAGATASYALQLEDVITLHIMEDDSNPVTFNAVKELLNSPGADNFDTNNELETEGYAINGAFAIAIDRVLQRARLNPTSALLNLCNFRATRPTITDAFPSTCIVRRDVDKRAFPSTGGAPPTAQEVQPLRNGAGGAVVPVKDASRGANAAFMQTVLGGSDYALNLGYEYSYVVGERYNLNGRYLRAWWINPGYEWAPAQTGGQSRFSISQSIVLVALVAMDEGFSGVRRRMLLQTGANSGEDALGEVSSGVVGQMLTYDISRNNMMAQAYNVPMENIAIFTAELSLTDFQACLPESELRPELRKMLEDAANGDGVATEISTLQIVGMQVQKRGVVCRRAGGVERKLLSAAVARVDMMIVFADTEVVAFDIDKFKAAAPSVGAFNAVQVPSKIAVTVPEEEEEGGLSMAIIIAAAAGGATALCICGLGAFYILRRNRKEAMYVDAVQVVDLNARGKALSKEDLLAEARGLDRDELTVGRKISSEALLPKSTDSSDSFRAEVVFEGEQRPPTTAQPAGPPPPRNPSAQQRDEDYLPPPREHVDRARSEFNAPPPPRRPRDDRDDRSPPRASHSASGRRRDDRSRSRSGEREEKRSVASSQRSAGGAAGGASKLPPLPVPVAHYDCREASEEEHAKPQEPAADILTSAVAWLGGAK